MQFPRRAARQTAAFLLSVSVGLCLPVAAAPCPHPPEPEALLRLLNTLRQQGSACGKQAIAVAGALRWQPMLAESARRYAQELAQRNTLTHTGADGGTLRQRLRQAGYLMRTGGENLASGPDEPHEVLALWMDSPEHCDNLMAGDFTEVGMACELRGEGRMPLPFWVMHLGRPLPPLPAAGP